MSAVRHSSPTEQISQNDRDPSLPSVQLVIPLKKAPTHISYVSTAKVTIKFTRGNKSVLITTVIDQLRITIPIRCAKANIITLNAMNQTYQVNKDGSTNIRKFAIRHSIKHNISNNLALQVQHFGLGVGIITRIKVWAKTTELMKKQENRIPTFACMFTGFV
jgi:hypothetical protein